MNVEERGSGIASQPANAHRLILILLCALAIALRLYVFLTTRYTADDALITFRYAENLTSGHGFIYNAGERVLGTTAPLFGLLIALWLKIGISPFWSTFVMNQLADIFSAWCLLQIFSGIRHPASGILSWLPSFLFLFSPESLQWSISGMETQVSIALITGACFFASRERWPHAFALAAIAFVLRIDGVAVVGAVLVAALLRQRKVPWKSLALLVAILAPWFVFTFRYYGSPIPNSAAAKMALSGNSEAGALWFILAKGFLHLNTIGALLLVFATCGSYAILKRRKELTAFLIWTWGYAASYTLAAGPMHPWYYPPFYAGYLVLLFVGLDFVYEKIPVLQRRLVIVSVTCLTIASILVFSELRVQEILAMQTHSGYVNQQTGMWLDQNTPADSVVAIKDIGAIGYYSHRKILDLAGLVSPECISFRARGDFLGPIEKFRPDYFAFSSGQIKALNLEQSDLMRYYQPVKVTGDGTSSYTIFQKIK